MKKIGKVLFAVVAMVLLAFPTVSSADSKIDETSMKKTSNPNFLFDEETGMYYDKKQEGYIDEVYQVNGKNFKKVDVKDYIEIKAVEAPSNFVSAPKESTLKKGAAPQAAPQRGTYYDFNESFNEERRFFGDRASRVQENPGPGDDRLSLSYSASKSSQFNVGLNTSQFRVWKADLGYTYISSETISSSHMMTIPAGYSGYWRFDPRMRYSRGTFTTYYDGIKIDIKDMKVYYPTRVNGDLDGWLVAVKKPL
ncbi:hypothetical protein [Pontibacillus halophilus]|uniref:hypothetical protein n=1 Tax=Pontibacillus halophilus TaxID=516704 RepID=UPI0003FCDEF7|nr:hypothetical protein [Pontibacillus halophilus]